MEAPSPSGEVSAPRRPLKTREATWPRTLASWLIRAGLKPNQVSILSISFSIGTAAAFVQAGRFAAMSQPRISGDWLLLAAVGIQLRLLCNLLDGLMAIEGGLKSKTGNLYNDVPDRISDSLTLIAAGYSISHLDWAPPLGSPSALGPTLGWAAALLAALTAYVRLLGGACGPTQYFIGPMAKQQRMGLLTAACLLGFASCWIGIPNTAVKMLEASLWVIIIGSVVTCVRRLRRIARDLNAS